VRSLFSCLCFVLLLPSSTMPQSGGRGRPPGIATADTMANQPLEAPLESRSHQINFDQVNAETQELRRLADGLPPQMDQVAKGQMPKDLGENLKRIEKLAKHLRSETTP
jgi:hypothetical protein